MYTEKDLQAELDAYKNELKSVQDRADLIEPWHEDIVLIDRIDVKKLRTFLHVDEAANKDRIRESWYGRVLKVSDRDTGDDIKNAKKSGLKVGSMVSFSTETPYSLNIEGFYSIWVLSIENIIAVDHAFDPVQKMEANLRKKLEVSNRKL